MLAIAHKHTVMAIMPQNPIKKQIPYWIVYLTACCACIGVYAMVAQAISRMPCTQMLCHLGIASAVYIPLALFSFLWPFINLIKYSNSYTIKSIKPTLIRILFNIISTSFSIIIVFMFIADFFVSYPESLDWTIVYLIIFFTSACLNLRWIQQTLIHWPRGAEEKPTPTPP